MERINMRLNFSYVQCTGVDRQWNKNYSDWLGLKIALRTHVIRIDFGLWNQRCFCESRNPQVFLTQVVPLNNIYIFEDINWSVKPKHCENSLGISADQSSKCWYTIGRFQWLFYWILNVLIFHEFLTAGYIVFWATVPVSRGAYIMSKPREFVHNKSETIFTLSERRQSTTLFGVETSRFYSMPKLENFLNHKAKIITEIAWYY